MRLFANMAIQIGGFHTRTHRASRLLLTSAKPAAAKVKPQETTRSAMKIVKRLFSCLVKEADNRPASSSVPKAERLPITNSVSKDMGRFETVAIATPAAAI